MPEEIPDHHGVNRFVWDDEIIVHQVEWNNIQTQIATLKESNQEGDEALAETLALVGEQETTIAAWQNVALFLSQVLAAIYRYRGSDAAVTATLALAGLAEYQSLVEGESPDES